MSKDRRFDRWDDDDESARSTKEKFTNRRKKPVNKKMKIQKARRDKQKAKQSFFDGD